MEFGHVPIIGLALREFAAVANGAAIAGLILTTVGTALVGTGAAQSGRD